MARTIFSALLANALFTACAEQEPIFSGRHVDYYGDIDGPVLCAGGLEHVDRYIERVSEFLGGELAENYRTKVWIGDGSKCTSNQGCYLSGERIVYIGNSLDPPGYTTGGLLRHEVSHAVIDHFWGQSAPFFEEGLAETLANSLVTGEVPDSLSSVRSMLGASAPQVDYTAAARFSRYLIDAHGLEQFRKLYQSAGNLTEDEIVSRIEVIYSEDYETLEKEYLAAGLRCKYQLHICDSGEDETLEPNQQFLSAASCLDPDFYGSENNLNTGTATTYVTMATQTNLHVRHGGTYRLFHPVQIARDSGGLIIRSNVLLTRCGDCTQQFSEFITGSDELYLPEGTYTLEFNPVEESVMMLDLEVIELDP